MAALWWIVGASLAAGVLSVACAALFALSARPTMVPVLVSYAIGALLGAAFLEILPHALETGQSPERLTAFLLFGILLFFVLEKLVLWRHDHGNGGAVEEEPAAPVQAHAHAHHRGNLHGHGHGHHSGRHHHAVSGGHDHGRSGLMILVGNTFHNFVDGVIIAGAFIASTQLGIVTALAIIAHEIPQEVGDFVIMLHSGFARRKAVLYNLISSVATLFGGLLAWFALESAHELLPPLLCIAAASMIYVAVADLIPGLHKRTALSATLQQVVLIALGIASIWVVRRFVGHPG